MFANILRFLISPVAFFDDQEQARRERYLNSSQSIVDLEMRMREIDRWDSRPQYVGGI